MTVNTGYFTDFAGTPKYTWMQKTNSKYLLAEATKTARTALRVNGINVGQTCALAANPENTTSGGVAKGGFYVQVWDFVDYLSSTSKYNWSTATDYEKACLILGKSLNSGNTGILLYPDEMLDWQESQPQSGTDGFSFFAQDIEVDNSWMTNKRGTNSINAIKSFAGITATLWAAGIYLNSNPSKTSGSPNTKIIPVVSRSITENILYNASVEPDCELVDLSKVKDEVDSLLPQALPKYLDGSGVPSTKIKTASGVTTIDRTSWNFMSLLYANSLIDGFISERYIQSNIGPNSPLTITPNAAPYYASTLNMPYALMASVNNPINAHIPFKTALPPSERVLTNFYGDAVVNSGMYMYPNKVPNQPSLPGITPGKMQAWAEGLEPDQYFIPQPMALTSHNASMLQVNGDCIIDFSFLPKTNTTRIDVHLSREAEYSSYSGFYKIVDSAGAVQDPISGKLISPGEAGYKEAALANENKITELSQLQLNADGLRNRAVSGSFNGEFMMAPYTVITEPGRENTFFDFASANTDGMKHFKRLSPNVFGMEDIHGGGDNDFNDLIISFQFLEVT